jgi:2-C-methyl-D-erythritol 4-phosphate cytidylyltransferase
LTPQLFRKQALIASIKAAQVNKVVVTDEASAMEANGGVVKLVDSRRCNIKVTQPEDLQLAEFYLEQERSV